MNNWGQGNLPDFVELLSGCTVTTSQFGRGTKYVTVQQLYYGNTIDVYSSPSVKVSEYQIERYKLLEGDILIGKSSVKLEGIGYPALFKGVREDVIYSNFTVRIRSKSLIDQNYLFYWLRSESSRQWIISQAQKSALTNINQNIINRFPIKFPKDKRVQSKLAQILISVDDAIEKTEALIEKYQQIKAGLMHDLFTRGIGVDGKLRPPREDAPELYQLTPIGWIPKDWKVDELFNLLAPIPNNLRSGPFGSALLKNELVEVGIPFLGIDNIFVEEFIDEFKRFVDEKKFVELFKYSVKPDDVIITIMGTVGRAAVVPKHIDKALSSKHLWTMSFNKAVVNPELICWQLNYASWVKSWFRTKSQGGIMEAIQSKTLKTLVLPVPSPLEQEEIYKKYSKISTKIKSEKLTLEKLQKQKSGLMHDLLTAKVQVPIQNAEAAHV